MIKLFIKMNSLKVLYHIWRRHWGFLVNFFIFFLRVQLISESTTNTRNLSNKELRKQHPDLFSGISELVKSFQLFHRLMLTSREMFRRADLLMQAYVKQQTFLVCF